MDNVFDKFVADLEKNLASTRPRQKAGTVTTSITDYEELVGARTLIGVLQNAFTRLDCFDFHKVAGIILGVEPPEQKNAFDLGASFKPENVTPGQE